MDFSKAFRTIASLEGVSTERRKLTARKVGGSRMEHGCPAKGREWKLRWKLCCDMPLTEGTEARRYSRRLRETFRGGLAQFPSVEAWTIGLSTEPTTRQQSPCWRTLGWLAKLA